MSKFLLFTIILSNFVYSNTGHMAGEKNNLPPNSYSNLRESNRKLYECEDKGLTNWCKKFKYLEFDVNESADGELFVFHDKSNIKTDLNMKDPKTMSVMEKASKRTGKKIGQLDFRDMLSSELKELKLRGSSTEGIPTLEGFMRIASENGYPRPIRPEIKEIRSEQAMDKFVNILKKTRDGEYTRTPSDCYGAFKVQQQFKHFATFGKGGNPYNCKPNDQLSLNCELFYKGIISKILKGNPTNVPGFKSFKEFTANTNMSRYIRDSIKNSEVKKGYLNRNLKGVAAFDSINESVKNGEHRVVRINNREYLAHQLKGSKICLASSPTENYNCNKNITLKDSKLVLSDIDKAEFAEVSVGMEHKAETVSITNHMSKECLKGNKCEN